MNYNKRFILIAVACAISIIGPALNASAITTRTTDSGDWSGGVTWSAGIPTAADRADITSAGVVVTQAGEVCDSLNVARAGLAGDLTIISGDVTSTNAMAVGWSNTGVLHMEGGTLNCGDNFSIGVQDGTNANGTLWITGGTTNIGLFFNVGRAGTDVVGEVIMDGAGGTLNIGNRTGIGESPSAGGSGTLTIRPTANGAPGLTTLTAGAQLVLGTGSILNFDPQYAAQVGDSWTVGSGSIVIGTFGSVTTASGYTVNVVHNAADVTLTVTATPAAGLPASQAYGLAITALLICLAGGIMVSRHRKHSA